MEKKPLEKPETCNPLCFNPFRSPFLEPVNRRRRRRPSNPLFRPPFLLPLTPHSFSSSRPFLGPVTAHSFSPNPLFCAPNYFMDLVNKSKYKKNRVRVIIKVAQALVTIRQGENLLKRFLSFSQQNSHPVMILRSRGMISTVMLLGSKGLVVSYEGRFEIQKLCGRLDKVTGLIELFLEFIMNDSTVISGIVMGPLIAAACIEVIYVPLIQYTHSIPYLSLACAEIEDGENENGESESGECEEDGECEEYGESDYDEDDEEDEEDEDDEDDESENGDDESG